jgi:RNA polymerase sigma-70 factor (ECF subfamily)
MTAGSIDELYQRYFPLIREKSRRMLGNEAEAQDVAQETFVRFWRERHRLEGHGPITAWLYRTCTRLAIDQLRHVRMRHRSEPELTLALLLEHATFDPEAVAATRQLLVRLAGDLTGELLELGVLSWMDGLSQTEIAEVIGTTERTVRRRLRRLEDAIERFRLEKSA